jgi:plastocyanin
MPSRSASLAVALTTAALAACSGGGTQALTGAPPSPSLTPGGASTATTGASAPSGASPSATGAVRTAAATAPATTAMAKATTTPVAPRASSTHPTKPSSSPRPSAAAACAGGTGTTSTIQEVAPDRFSPSTVSIHRCDSVRAVYADTTGAPHTWQGSGWNSGNMSSSGQSFTFRFTSTGRFNFFCSYHQSVGMTGTVTVS